MNIVVAVGKELLSMFLADARLAVAILLLVAAVGSLVSWRSQPFLGGSILLLGSLAILVGTACREARKRRHP
jgi:hypothetical protein